MKKRKREEDATEQSRVIITHEPDGTCSLVLSRLNNLDLANKQKIEREVIDLLKESESVIETLDISGYQPALGGVFFKAIGHSRIHTLHMKGVDLRGCTNFHEHLAGAVCLENLYMSGCTLPVPRVKVFSKLVTAPLLKKFDKSNALFPQYLSRPSYELDEGEVDIYIKSDVQTSNEILLKHAFRYVITHHSNDIILLPELMSIVAGYLGADDSTTKAIEVVGEGDYLSYLS